ncbi:MAG: DNA-3-methyladenine glycosylase I [Flavobacteriales bacterium]
MRAAVTNAQAFHQIVKEKGSFSDYLWSFVNGKVIKNTIQDRSGAIAISPESDAMSKDLKRRGFKFVGSTICYAFMQAVGMLNDHAIDCFRYEEV